MPLTPRERNSFESPKQRPPPPADLEEARAHDRHRPFTTETDLEARAHPLGVGDVQRAEVAPHTLVARLSR